MSESVMHVVLRAQEAVGWPPIAIEWRTILQALNQVRSVVVVPLLTLTVWLCVLGSSLLLTEKIFMGSVSLLVKLLRRRPRRIYPCAPMAEDEEVGTAAYPMVIVQIPMYNEKEVYHLSIGAACSLQWPAERLIVEVLDDSTDPLIKDLVQKECDKWSAKGVNVRYERRGDRKGYKAGALREGMKHSYVNECDYVAIFDADFQPESDFLTRTVPLLVLMMRIQEMSMDYHFKVEQESGSSTHAFSVSMVFGGSMPLMRLEDGKTETTVEDMDLAIRATLQGWKFIYLGDVKLLSTFKAYRNQQHRWSCGPAKLKFYLMYNFFLVRRIISHLVTFYFYCIVIPTASFFPEVQVPFDQWCTSLQSIYLLVLWVLFENVMSLHLRYGDLPYGLCFRQLFPLEELLLHLYLFAVSHFIITDVGYVGTFIPNSK
ncbi:unnamed protein product [Spirodela intermedia]|uniref:Glycosyltransferase 2-like domain-containing protein n=1 Tax=Spirodela intermedia TaxID=51605 RepID=A0A7I8IU16_SPIIN|nr:unnamed protein product [Spirodela intermedia]CAA6661316.1 unnamed protein product [Spirodela intermedia]